MDEATARKFEKNLIKMRAKVVKAKGEGVKGLSPLPQQAEEQIKSVKTRGPKV